MKVLPLVVLSLVACGSGTGSPATLPSSSSCKGTISGAATATEPACEFGAILGGAGATLNIDSMSGPSGTGLTVSAPASAVVSYVISYGFSDDLSAKTYTVDDADVEAFSGGSVTINVGTTFTTYSSTKNVDGSSSPGSTSLTFSRVVLKSNVGEPNGGAYSVTGTFDGTLVNQQGSDTVTVHLQFAN